MPIPSIAANHLANGHSDKEMTFWSLPDISSRHTWVLYSHHPGPEPLYSWVVSTDVSDVIDNSVKSTTRSHDNSV